MNTTEQNNQPANEEKSNAAEKDQPANAMVGGHVAPPENGEASEEERIVRQAQRAEQPEPGAKTTTQKDRPSDSASDEIINNTGDDPDAADADAATG